MNESNAFCPQCKREVTFVKTADSATCPQCGFVYALTGGRAPGRGASSDVRTVLRVLLIVFLIMVALTVVGVAVLFAGCAAIMKGF